MESVSFFQRVLRVVTAPGRGVINLTLACYKRFSSRKQPGVEDASTSTESSWLPERRARGGSVVEFPRWVPEAAPFTLVELLVTIALIGVSTALLLPGLVSLRQAQRRAQCANNLKQLAVAANSYASSHGCFPGGSYSGTLFNPPHLGTQVENLSCFVRMLPWLDQAAMYDAVNFNLTSADPANLTIAGVPINTLMCPSDTLNQRLALPATAKSGINVTPGWSFNQIYPLPPGKWMQSFTSYAGNAGTFNFGFSNLMSPEVLARYNGVIYNDSSVKIADITDGTGNTFLFGERSKGHMYILDPLYAVSDNAWASGRWHDTLFATHYPVNLAGGNSHVFGSHSSIYYFPTATGSYHPGGANFAFCDGSVRFIKESIDSWTFNTPNADDYGDRMPDGTVFKTVPALPPYSKTGYYLEPGSAQLGIYQRLSTRSGNEIIPTDSY